MYAFDQGKIIATDTTFTDNAAKLYGGALSAYQSSIDATGCLFENNIANSTGGAISGYAESTVTTTGCTYKANRAQYVTAMASAATCHSLQSVCSMLDHSTF